MGGKYQGRTFQSVWHVGVFQGYFKGPQTGARAYENADIRVSGVPVLLFATRLGGAVRVKDLPLLTDDGMQQPGNTPGLFLSHGVYVVVHGVAKTVDPGMPRMVNASFPAVGDWDVG